MLFNSPKNLPLYLTAECLNWDTIEKMQRDFVTLRRAPVVAEPRV